MVHATAIAPYIVYLGSLEPEPDLTNLKLQKLLYYAQAWHLVFRQEPLFTDRIEAWRHGPVVPSVFRQYRHFEDRRIEPSDEPIRLSDARTPFVEDVWHRYKDFSASKLWAMTHSDGPWNVAREGLAPDVNSDREITLNLIRDYFESEYSRNALPGFELDSVRRSEQQFAEGHSIALEQVAERLGL